MPGTFTKSVVEEAALGWLGEIGYTVPHGPAIAAGEPAAERSDPAYRDRHSGKPIATGARAPQSGTAARGAGRRLPQADQSRRALAVERNRAIHRMLVDGTTVEHRRKDGSIAGAQALAIDFDDPDNNEWLAVNQFTVAEGQNDRRPRRGAVRQRVAAGGNRAEERRRRKRRYLVGVPPVANLSGANPGAVHRKRGVGRLRRHPGSRRRGWRR